MSRPSRVTLELPEGSGERFSIGRRYELELGDNRCVVTCVAISGDDVTFEEVRPD